MSGETWEAYSDEEAEIVQLLMATDIEDLFVEHTWVSSLSDYEYVASCTRKRGWFHTEHFAAHVATSKPRGRVLALERLMILIGQRSRLQTEVLHDMERAGL